MKNVQRSAVFPKILQRCKVGADNKWDLHESMMYYKRGFGKKVKCTAKEDSFNGNLTEERASLIILSVRKDNSIWGMTLVQG
jgi:hypothetical protein